jgi:hypothetical protein
MPERSGATTAKRVSATIMNTDSAVKKISLVSAE